MNSFILTVRAIGAALALRLAVPVIIITVIWFAVFFGGTLWLTTLSGWWWLLMIPLTSLFCIALGVGFVFFMLIRHVQPQQTTAQKRAVKEFVDKMQHVAEIAGTPKFLILIRVVRSIAAPTKDTYLSDILQDRQLVSDFKALQRSFRDDIVVL